MLRRFVVPFVAFVLPYIVFGIYRMLRARGQQARAWPLTVLFVAGAVLAGQTFLLAALTEPRATVRPPDHPIVGPPLKEYPPDSHPVKDTTP